MYCKNCGKELSSDAKFCSECGTKVEVEMPKPKAVEPMFFTKEEKASEPEQEKPKKVMHLDEFNWDLEGYPTSPRVTEEVDFNWASVLEEKARNTAPRVQPVKEEKVEETAAEPADDGKSLEEEIFEDMESAPLEEPTRLIGKDQMQVSGVDKFYRFNQKQADIQAVLDEEYARIQRGEEEDVVESAFEEEEKQLPDFLVEEAVEESVELEATVEEIEVDEGPELVAVVWSQPPAGILATSEAPVEVTTEEPKEAAGTSAVEEVNEEEVSPSKGEKEESDAPAGEENAITEEPERKLTFDDVFSDDEDDDEEKEKGGCLKVIAIILCVLVVIELAILGIQFFAPNSQAGKYVDQAYKYVVSLIPDFPSGDEPQQEEAEPSELAQLICAQVNVNQNLGAVEENAGLIFEEGKDYGFAEIADTYAFQNSPWYDNEEGKSISFGDELIGTLIQYYSASADQMNAVNEDVLNFVDDTSSYYEELSAVVGAEDNEYKITKLEIGEIRTGGSGFYVLTNVTITDKAQTEGEEETQVVYLEPNTSKKEMKIINVKTI